MIKGFYREKFTMMHIKKGSVGTALIAVFATLLLTVPSMMFLLKAYLSGFCADSARETLQIASIDACQGIRQELLGEGVLALDIQKAKQLFLDSANAQLALKSYLITVEDPSVSITVKEDKVIVMSSLTIQTTFGDFRPITNTAEFITETIPEELP
jgi:hypothetical protein